MIGGEDNGKSPDNMSNEEISARLVGTLSTSLEAIRLEIRALTVAVGTGGSEHVKDIHVFWEEADAAAKLIRDSLYIDEGDTS